MKVSLSTSGGWAAPVRLGAPARIVDGRDLSPSAAAELASLTSAAEASQALSDAAPGRGGDVASYVITIEDGGRSVVLRQSDKTMTPAFAKLLEWIETQPTR
jgi:hypothetical protein